MAELIENIPLVSSIKLHLDSGLKLKHIDASPGAITVLRWIVGSCRAYLKETKPGEGVLNAIATAYATGDVVRQFTFVVGSTEQEDNFKQEIVTRYVPILPLILSSNKRLIAGSGTERWHNILRTGLDYNETVCGRVSLVCWFKTRD